MQSTLRVVRKEADRDWNWDLKLELVIGFGSSSVDGNWQLELEPGSSDYRKLLEVELEIGGYIGVWSYWSFRLVDQVGIEELNVLLLFIKPC